MGSLEPLGGHLPDEARELAAELRRLFTGLEVSVRRYAARRHRDAGSISRFLNGTRVPAWEFVADLLTDVAECRGGAATPETMEHLRGLHRRALAASGSPLHRVELLEQQLVEADRMARRSAVREQALENALLDAQHRAADLETQFRQLQAAADDREWALADAETALRAYEDPLAALRKERDQLKDQVEVLSEELKEAHTRRIRAEQRCNDLERQLVTAEEEARAGAAREAEQEERAQAARTEALEEELLRLRRRVEGLDDQLDEEPRYFVTVPADGPERTRSDTVTAGGLDRRYAFENFAVEPSNRFAHDLAVAVAEVPAQNYNPLVIHGDHGLGKTHLLHAIGHYTRSLYPRTRALYIDCMRLVGLLRVPEVDMLLIDDILPLDGGDSGALKSAQRGRLLHVLDDLLGAGKQIALTSARPLSSMRLDPELRERLSGGLPVGMGVPDDDTRRAVLRMKAERERLDVPPAVLEMIAARAGRNIRELEGALVRVTAFASLNRSPIDLLLTETVLNDMARGVGTETTGEDIIRATADYFGLTVEDLRGPERARVRVTARQIAMYLCRELTEYSVPTIAAFLGGRDPSAVLNADRKIRALMSERRSIYNQVTELTSRLLFS
ncbi:DnaA ATPase domain-containing protein [Streptomyces sp. NEAU-Y11]|uniref:DnaA ATPase domain-containing protein n=1 Tax=Streptomyces cucumeris TaxID=2962890 RepID=UPI0020C87DF7|nr:DnaA/Hda family protein [Streptomyces sp. NEAU-Y11]MCP9209051.1 DnaA/Hda family protein [Streptomyces sp. NEAU-Y11]